MSWEDVLKIYYGRSNMEKAKKLEKQLKTMFDALNSGQFDETMKYAQNEVNFGDEYSDVEPLKLSKEELLEVFKALLVGVDGQIMNAGEQMAEDAGDRAFVSHFER